MMKSLCAKFDCIYRYNRSEFLFDRTKTEDVQFSEDIFHIGVIWLNLALSFESKRSGTQNSAVGVVIRSGGSYLDGNRKKETMHVLSLETKHSYRNYICFSYLQDFWLYCFRSNHLNIFTITEMNTINDIYLYSMIFCNLVQTRTKFCGIS